MRVSRKLFYAKKNKKDIEEINEHYLKSLKINYVENVREVLDLALLNEKVRQPIEFIIPEDRPNIV